VVLGVYRHAIGRGYEIGYDEAGVCDRCDYAWQNFWELVGEHRRSVYTLEVVKLPDLSLDYPLQTVKSSKRYYAPPPC